MTYSLTHSFIKQVVEGDELYTKVGSNVPKKKVKAGQSFL